MNKTLSDETVESVRKQLEKALTEGGILHSEETGFTLREIAEKHLYNLGIGNGHINISEEIDGEVSRVSKVPLSMLREL